MRCVNAHVYLSDREYTDDMVEIIVEAKRKSRTWKLQSATQIVRDFEAFFCNNVKLDRIVSA